MSAVPADEHHVSKKANVIPLVAYDLALSSFEYGVWPGALTEYRNGTLNVAEAQRADFGCK
jgi:hypothetical protein